jgi:hypothetical protein
LVWTPGLRWLFLPMNRPLSASSTTPKGKIMRSTTTSCHREPGSSATHIPSLICIHREKRTSFCRPTVRPRQLSTLTWQSLASAGRASHWGHHPSATSLYPRGQNPTTTCSLIFP